MRYSTAASHITCIDLHGVVLPAGLAEHHLCGYAVLVAPDVPMLCIWLNSWLHKLEGLKGLRAELTCEWVALG